MDLSEPGQGANGQSKKFLRRNEAAEYIRDTYSIPCTQQYLAKAAVVGGGPKFRKAGRYPLYELVNLDEWAAAKISALYSSTAEYSKAA